MPGAFRAIAAGRVQGVGFRWATVRAAQDAGALGWVCNLADGRVEAHVEGSDDQLEMMKAFLSRGPRSARVDRLDVRATEVVGSFEDFRIVAAPV